MTPVASSMASAECVATAVPELTTSASIGTTTKRAFVMLTSYQGLLGMACLLDQLGEISPGQGANRQVKAAGEPELLKDVRQMGLDGPFRNCEPVGDFLVAGSRRDQGHDLGLARGETVECRGRPMRRQAEVFRLTELLKHTCQEFLQPSDQSTGWPGR